MGGGVAGGVVNKRKGDRRRTTPGSSGRSASKGRQRAPRRAGDPAGGRPGRAASRGGRREGLGGDQVEGRNAVLELLRGDRRVREVYVVEDRDSPVLAEIADLAAQRRVTVHQVSSRRLEGLARSEVPQGVVAMAAPLEPVELEDLARRPAPAGGAALVAVLDGITDPGNLGAILRSVEVLGFSGAVLPRHRAVRVTPAAAKAAAGAIEHLPLAVVGGVPAAISRLRELGVWVVGLDSSADQPVSDIGVADEPLALVLGSEGAGLSRLARERCDRLVAIPQPGLTDSLNVAAAAAVAAHEIVRQRRELRRRNAGGSGQHGGADTPE